jgi:HSP20 family molecular chaperone IbpA
MNSQNNVSIILLSLLVLLLSGGISCLFEWVHPDEWQHRSNPVEDAPTLGERIKDQAEKMGHAVKEKAEDITESVKEGGRAISDKFSHYGHQYTEDVSQLGRKSKHEIFEPMMRMMNHAMNIFEEELKPSHWRHPHHGWPSRFETNPRLWREYPDEYLLFLDIPGIPKADLHVNLTGHNILVTGHHGSCIRPSKSGKQIDRMCLERAIDETIRLPEDVNPNGVECKFKEGVLIVKMPKIKVSDRRKIKVEDYVPSWSEVVKEAKDTVMGKLGFHGHEDQPAESGDAFELVA